MVLALAACSEGDDNGTDDDAGRDEVLLRTGAALSLSAARRNPAAADAHRAHAELLDPAVTDSHSEADAAWASAADAELALAATFQAWAGVLSTPALRQRAMRCGASCARFYAVALSMPPSLPEAFQLVDPRVPDAWLLRS